ERVVTWISGIKASTVLHARAAEALDTDNARLTADNGEVLHFRELPGTDGLQAIGFRHELPDAEGRVWRTEAVLRFAGPEQPSTLRLRGTSLAAVPGAKLEVPRKPYLVKDLLRAGFVADDGDLAVREEPHRLSGDDVELAARLITGSGTTWLPVLYVSAPDERPALDDQALKKLAFALGGIAHVVVEPDRRFSFRLRDACGGKNPYAGAVGLALPDTGIVRRYMLGPSFPTAGELVAHLIEETTRFRTFMPSRGWDWSELQEQALRAQRERERKRLSAEELVALYQEEVENLEERVRELEQKLQESAPSAAQDQDEDWRATLAQELGPELWAGEVVDRLRYAARQTLDRAQEWGLNPDGRTCAVLHRFLDATSAAKAGEELKGAIRQACKDPKRMARDLIPLLERHGYEHSAQNRHHRLHARPEYPGLEPITLPTTPSDYRGLRNMASLIGNKLEIDRR
ncbi:MAG: hypothetical protein D6760_08785, partial [Deltaproteobacteria bacterium]